MSDFDIGSRHVGDGAPCFIVGEVAQAHHGSYDLAHAFVDAIADAGADAVKFQAHNADAESWPEEPWRVKPKWGNETRFEYWKRMEFTFAQWRELANHARKRKLAFVVSPFCVAAYDLIDAAARPDAWKVASGQITDHHMLRVLSASGRPVVVSTGMATDKEITEAVDALQYSETDEPADRVGDGPVEFKRYRQGTGCRVALLQCTSIYPCPPNALGLCNLADLRSKYNVPVGLSDHSGTIHAGIGAAALGCNILEVHVKLSDYDPGPDASSSITVPQLKQLVEGVRFTEEALRRLDKNVVAEHLAPIREMFMGRHERRVSERQDGENQMTREWVERCAEADRRFEARQKGAK